MESESDKSSDEKEERKEIKKEKEVTEKDSKFLKHTERGLWKLSLSENEISKIPSRVTTFWAQFYYGFIYAFIGVYYVFKNKLYRYMYIEGGLCVSFFSVTLSITIITSFIISFGTTLQIFVPIVIWLVDLIVQALISQGVDRTSYIEEHRMKGSEYEFGMCEGVDDGDEGCSCSQFCLVVCCDISATLACKLVRQCIMLIILPILSFLFYGWMFPIGFIIYGFALLYLYGLNFGYSSIEAGFLSRKYKTIWERLAWAFRHHNLVLGYGLASMLCYCCPFVQVIFYLFCSIGATRLALYIMEEESANNSVIGNIKVVNSSEYETMEESRSSTSAEEKD